MGRAATLLALLSASCVSSSSNVCDDGSTCPGGFVCDVANQRCLLPAQSEACVDKDEGADCSYEGAAPGACRAGACISFFCGDGYVTAGEDCEQETSDGTDPLQGKTCDDFGFYAPATGLGCTTSCTFDLGAEDEHSGCYANNYCGDDKINGVELCDGPEERTCLSIGFDAGTTSCNLQCGFSIGDCSRFGWNPESLSEVIAFAVAGTAHDNQWAFGQDGKAMQFEGAYWIPRATGVANDLINGWTFGASDTWAVGISQANPALSSVLLHWTGINSGWSVVSGVPAGEYVDVWGPSANELYVAADVGILKYNGTWSTVPGFSSPPKQIRGTSGSDIWVSTVTGTFTGPLMHYNGSTWTDESPTPDMTVQFIDANSPTDVWTLGFSATDPGKGMIAHYDGADWQTWSKSGEQYNVIAATAPHDAWIGGADGVMRHWDGDAWSSSANIGASPTGLTALSGMIALGPDEIVAVSTLNLAYRYRGQAFGVIQKVGNDPYYDPFTSPINTAVWSSSPNNQYVTNVKGEVWHYDGSVWTLKYTTPAAAIINDIWGLPDTDNDPATENIWIAAADGSAYHYDGATWTPFAVSASQELNRVWFNATDVWVFTDNIAYHKQGTTWPATPLALNGRVESVSASSSSNLWAVQNGPGSVWHYDGNWTEVPTGATYPVLAVAAIADNDVHVTAENGRFEHFNGSVWSETAIPVLDSLRHISYTANDDVIAASARDIAHFNGTSWSTMRTPVDFVPNTADYLPIVDLSVTPGRIDMLQQRFRIRTLIRTKPLICRDNETGSCKDGVDNDCDGKVDNVDPQCPP